MSAATFDAQLIPEYDGSTDVVEWVAQTEMLCELRGIALEIVLPLRVTGGAFPIWLHSSTARRCSLTDIRDGL